MASCDSSDSDIEDMRVLTAAAAAVFIAVSRKRAKRRWVREWIERRSRLGAYSCLLQELTCQDPAALRNFLRMDPDAFDQLLALIGPKIRKQDTRMRQSIPPGERLAVTLRYLAEGCSFKELMYLYRVPDNTVSTIIHTTCKAIYEVLQPICLKVPQTEDSWRKIAQEFEDKWNFPNCIGAIDGKHVAIMSPGEGSMYWNYKGFHSIILLALVDANYKFLFVDVGSNGRAGDAGVFKNPTLASSVEKGLLNIPPHKTLPGREREVPFCFVGDDAFPLKPYLLKPYPSRNFFQGAESDQENERKKVRIFDYRLSRARRVVENAFGILSSRFGVFRKPMLLKPSKATDVTLAAICLHNFLCDRKDGAYTSHPDKLNGLTSLPKNVGNRPTDAALDHRTEFKSYFCEEGQVPWQNKLLFN